MKALLAYDGSDSAEDALADLRRSGLPPDTEIIVLCAVDLIAAPDAQVDASAPPFAREAAAAGRARVEAALVEARAIAERGAARLRGWFPSWRVSSEAVADSPGWAILKRAEGLGGQAWKADLIVTGAGGRSTLDRVAFGSVAHAVLMNAHCSTRIGRAGPRGASGPPRLLIGVDGSEDSRAAVDAVARRQWPEGAECRVVAVADFRMTPSSTLPPLTPKLRAERLADESAAKLASAGLKATGVGLEGDATRRLVHEAADFAADCIFLGARGLTRIERFLLGSVSSSVTMRAECSVEIVRLNPV